MTITSRPKHDSRTAGAQPHTFTRACLWPLSNVVFGLSREAWLPPRFAGFENVRQLVHGFLKLIGNQLTQHKFGVYDINLRAFHHCHPTKDPRGVNRLDRISRDETDGSDNHNPGNSHLSVASCTSIMQRQDVRPLVLRDVPRRTWLIVLSPTSAAPAELRLKTLTTELKRFSLTSTRAGKTTRSCVPCVHPMRKER